MSSFIDLMGQVVWTEADISNRVTSMIRATYSADDEMKAARLARKPAPTVEDLAYIQAMDTLIADAIEQGRTARADMVLLQSVLDCEANPALLEGASETVLALLTSRTPQPVEPTLS